ncbi:MAG TPA: dihydrodipicolinate synthase family protein [Gemmatales bacterium]|nr:dihydrodipicolinate synthase family protein [Gemmatales bacterium]HMP59785.1 dihydrodipicolinate synthase family protein [Gemmatales bacterium]
MLKPSALARLVLSALLLFGIGWTAQGGDPVAATSRCGTPCRPAWAGIYPTVLTPWTCAGTVDLPALLAQVDYQLSGGVHGLLLLGTIGEGEVADHAERATVISAVHAHVQGRVPIIVGIHTADADVALAQMAQAVELGAAAVLVKYTPGCCVRFPVVYEFYRRLALTQMIDLFIYYYPSQTGLELHPAEIAQLLRLPRVVGIKNSILDLQHVRKQIELTQRPDRAFLSGTALNLTQFQEAGGHGAMCPEAALLPGPTVAAWRTAYELGALDLARQQQRELFVVAPLLTRQPVSARTARCFTMFMQDAELAQTVGAEASPARLKYALGGLGIPMTPIVKPPLRQLGTLERVRIDSQMPAIRRAAGGTVW